MFLLIDGSISNALATLVRAAPQVTNRGFSGEHFFASATMRRAPSESMGLSADVIPLSAPVTTLYLPFNPITLSKALAFSTDSVA